MKRRTLLAMSVLLMADAPGGAYSYLINNRMISGFAVIAWPVDYDETGVMSFMVSQSGDVYEKDLGPDTPTAAANITLFNPDKTWDKADMTSMPLRAHFHRSGRKET